MAMNYQKYEYLFLQIYLSDLLLYKLHYYVVNDATMCMQHFTVLAG